MRCRLGSGRRLPGLDRSAVAIRELADGDQDEVDQRPDAEAAQRDELQDTGADLAHVEAMDAEEAEEEAQQDGRYEALLADSADPADSAAAGDGAGHDPLPAGFNLAGL